MTLEERLYTALREAQAEISSLHEEIQPLNTHVRHQAFWDREALIAEYIKHRNEPQPGFPIGWAMVGILTLVLLYCAGLELARWMLS